MKRPYAPYESPFPQEKLIPRAPAKKEVSLEKRFDRFAFRVFVIPGVTIFGLLVLTFLLRLLFGVIGIPWPFGELFPKGLQ